MSDHLRMNAKLPFSSTGCRTRSLHGEIVWESDTPHSFPTHYSSPNLPFYLNKDGDWHSSKCLWVDTEQSLSISPVLVFPDDAWWGLLCVCQQYLADVVNQKGMALYSYGTLLGSGLSCGVNFQHRIGL